MLLDGLRRRWGSPTSWPPPHAPRHVRQRPRPHRTRLRRDATNPGPTRAVGAHEGDPRGAPGERALLRRRRLWPPRTCGDALPYRPSDAPGLHARRPCRRRPTTPVRPHRVRSGGVPAARPAPVLRSSPRRAAAGARPTPSGTTPCGKTTPASIPCSTPVRICCSTSARSSASTAGHPSGPPRSCSRTSALRGAACSDAHRVADVDLVATAIERLKKLVGAEEGERLLGDGPRAILRGGKHMKEKIGVVGLGVRGAACRPSGVRARKFPDTVGFDIDRAKIDELRRGF